MANTTITEGMVTDIARNYLAAALWTGVAWYPPGHPEHERCNAAQLDGLIDVDDLDDSVVTFAANAVRAFLGMVEPADLAEYCAGQYSPEDAAAQMGHDLFLTRNGHGAGFWDRGMGELGDRLSDVAHAMGEHELHAYLTVTADPDDLTGDDLDGPVTFDY